MFNRRKREIYTGVEIGSSMVKVVMGEFLPDDVLNIVGCGRRQSMRMMKGAIADARIVNEQLMLALSDAENSAGVEIGPVFLAVTGQGIRATTTSGSTVIRGDNGKITEDDVQRTRSNAQAFALPPDKVVLHYADKRFVIDGEREVLNPVGQVGSKLQADVTTIYGRNNAVQTNRQMLGEIMGYPDSGTAFSGMATGFGAFSRHEMERGALIVDLGAGVTEYMMFLAPGVYHCGQVAVGCRNIVNDLSLGLRLSEAKAQQILHQLSELGGSAVMNPDGRGRMKRIDVSANTTREIPLSAVEQIIDLRVRELFTIIARDLQAANALDRIAAGILLCGGGARIPGITELAEDTFKLPVQVGRPRLLSGEHEIVNSSRYVTPVGLLRWGKNYLDELAAEPPPMEQMRHDAGWLWDQLKRAFRW